MSNSVQIKSVITDTWHFVCQNILSIMWLCGPLILLDILLEEVVCHIVSNENTIMLYQLIISSLIYPLYTGALLLFLEQGSYCLSLKSLWKTTFKLWPRFVILSLLSSILILFGFSLILPAIWLIVVLVFAEYLLVLENHQPLDAIKKSIKICNGHFWTTAFFVYITLIPLWLLDMWIHTLTTHIIINVSFSLIINLLQLIPSILFFYLFKAYKENRSTQSI